MYCITYWLKKEKLLYFSHFVFKSGCRSLLLLLLLLMSAKLCLNMYTIYTYKYTVLWYIPMSVIKQTSQFLNGFSSRCVCTVRNQFFIIIIIYFFFCINIIVFLDFRRLQAILEIPVPYTIHFMQGFWFSLSDLSSCKLCKYFKWISQTLQNRHIIIPIEIYSIAVSQIVRPTFELWEALCLIQSLHTKTARPNVCALWWRYYQISTIYSYQFESSYENVFNYIERKCDY